MRRIAISFGMFVVLVVGVLNFIDAKYPELLHGVQPPAVVPASAPETATAASTPVQASQGGSQTTAATAAPSGRAPLEDIDYPGIYPGARIDRVVYGARPYVNMTVVSVNAKNIVLKNDREIVSIPTGSLPDNLRHAAIAYLKGTDGSTLARTGMPAFPAVPNSDRHPAAPPTAAVGPATEQNSAPDFEAIAWQAARDRAERWLRFERERRPTDIVPLLTGVDLKTPLPMTGLPGYWKVRGRGYVATYQAQKGGTFHDFEVTVVLDAKGNVLRADIQIL